MTHFNDYQAIVFDLDGTLLHTWPSLLQAVRSVTPGATPERVEELRLTLSQGIDPVFRAAACQPGVSPDAAAAAVAKMKQHYRDHTLTEVQPYPGTDDMLAQLVASGYRLALCTNRDRTSTQILLHHMGWLKYFSHVQCVDDGQPAKPDPGPLHVTLSHLNCPREQALFVGDSKVDAQCAANAEVDFAAHKNGYHAEPVDLIPAVVSYADTSEMMRWLVRQPVHALEI